MVAGSSSLIHKEAAEQQNSTKDYRINPLISLLLICSGWCDKKKRLRLSVQAGMTKRKMVIFINISVPVAEMILNLDCHVLDAE